MVPADGRRNLVRRLKQVVLPAPLGPISAWIECRRTVRSTALTATNPRKSLVSPRVSRILSPAGGDARYGSPFWSVWSLLIAGGGGAVHTPSRRHGTPFARRNKRGQLGFGATFEAKSRVTGRRRRGGAPASRAGAGRAAPR